MCVCGTMPSNVASFPRDETVPVLCFFFCCELKAICHVTFCSILALSQYCTLSLLFCLRVFVSPHAHPT